MNRWKLLRFCFLLLFVIPTESSFGPKADIAFIVDASGSVGADNWKKQLSFVKNIVQRFDIGPNATHFGALSFSTGYRYGFHLQEHEDKPSVLAAIDKMNYQGGSTATHRALHILRMGMFNPRNRRGPRAGVPRVGILITDGLPDDIAATIQEAAFVKRSGIGDQVNETLLSTLASIPSDRHLLTAADFDGLFHLADSLANRINADFSGHCPASWIEIRGRCLLPSENEVSYEKARTECASRHERGSLATASNKILYKDLTKRLVYPLTGYEFSYYIGLDDKAEKGVYVFSDGITIDGNYSEWIPYIKPYNKEGPGCVCLDNNEAFMWRVTDCMERKRYICEIITGMLIL
ncbi:collagen alpha-1(XIV) chain isoform X2 [Lingula anatina]|uniref:Collagen alpha-1(XIV) chain isoform X2 n=1 Tax=Lingula anatina TaxID=7574 RepID=A0A1S3JF55_LINAN|nr:collagen alpha-1(XIV) chain isoform X2 [Lingula anatina]|eukprot:XP_013408524.1 collagen alpha-1(XIV) chain isoform X2 [Lingula anatina]